MGCKLFDLIIKQHHLIAVCLMSNQTDESNLLKVSFIMFLRLILPHVVATVIVFTTDTAVLAPALFLCQGVCVIDFQRRIGSTMAYYNIYGDIIYK